MNPAMLNFLSEENLRRHTERLSVMKLRRSILIKETPALAGRDLFGTRKIRLPCAIRRDVEDVFGWILAHEIYFSSFADGVTRSRNVAGQYGSEAAFLYVCECMARDADGGFLWITKRNGLVIPRLSGDVRPGAYLGIDLCEHAYFMDYGFDRDSYVKAALCRLDLSRL